MTTRPVKGVKLKTDATGKVTLEPKQSHKSKSQQIAAKKNPKRTYRKTSRG